MIEYILNRDITDVAITLVAFSALLNMFYIRNVENQLRKLKERLGGEEAIE